MSQSDFGTIDPANKSGPQLAANLNDWRSAVHSTHSGVSRPSYVVAGMFWLDSTTATSPILKYYDGADDITVYTLDHTYNSNLLSGSVNGVAKNKIIGGDFSLNPWQRGTSFTAPVTGSYTADRFYVDHSTDGAVDVLKTADAPTVAEAGYFTQYCLHADVTTADAAMAAGQFYGIAQKIEGYNTACFGFGQAGTRYVTLSFWVKSTKTGISCVSIRNSATNRSYVAEYTVSSSDVWEKKTLTIPVDTSGTWLYDNGIGLIINFCLAAGSTYQTTAGSWAAGNFKATSNQVNHLDSASNNFKIALIQLEDGVFSTAFEKRTVQAETISCLRYFWRISGPFQKNVSSPTNTSVMMEIAHPVEMRISPTSISTTLTNLNFVGTAAGANQWGLQIANIAYTTLASGTIVVSSVASHKYYSYIDFYISGGNFSQASNMISVGSGLYIDISAEL